MLSTNRDRAAALLIDQGPLYRADMARLLGVSRTTVTNVVNTLLEAGTIEPEHRRGAGPAPVGEPAALKERLVIARRTGVLATVAHLPEKTLVALAALDGDLITLRSRNCAITAGGQDRMNTAVELLGELLNEGTVVGIPLRALHLAVNTQCDADTGAVLGDEASALWRGINPKQWMQDTFGVEVALQNTARLLGLAQHRSDAGTGARNLIYVHLAHGISMGHVLDGQIAGGSHGGAGELGHVSIDREGRPCACANRGCLMQYVGLAAIEDQVCAVLGPGSTVQDAVQAALAGSHACASIIAQAGTILGEALTTVCNLLDPDTIVLGGTLAQAGDALLDPIRQEVHRRALPLVTRKLRVSSAAVLSDQAIADAGIHAIGQDPELVDSIVQTLH